MKPILVAAAALLLMAGGAQAAPQLKPGLWNITSTTKMAGLPKIPPQVAAMMKEHGMSAMPGQGQPVTTQVCMTGKEDAGTDITAQMDKGQVGCTPQVTNQTANAVTTKITCTGMMKGTGHAVTTWHGNTHYEGDYSFKGTMHGMTQDLRTHYVGNWVKTDCGAVKPLDGQ